MVLALCRSPLTLNLSVDHGEDAHGSAKPPFAVTTMWDSSSVAFDSDWAWVSRAKKMLKANKNKQAAFPNKNSEDMPILFKEIRWSEKEKKKAFCSEVKFHAFVAFSRRSRARARKIKELMPIRMTEVHPT